MKKVVDKIISVVCIALIFFSILLVIASIVLKTVDKVVFIGKYAVIKITTDSMSPDLPSGSYILISKTDTAKLSKGDVITFYSEDPSIKGELNTHRIIDVKTDCFVTQGDNNKVPDAYSVSPKSVVGKYSVKLTFFKSMMKLLSNPFAYFVLILLPIGILVLVSVKDVIISTKQKQQSDTLALTIEQMKQSGELEKYLNSSANLDKDLKNDEQPPQDDKKA